MTTTRIKQVPVATAPFKSFKTMPFAERFNKLQIPATAFTVADEVNQFFFDVWPFPRERERKKFLGADFPRFVCYYFPTALEDRLKLTYKIVTHLFMVDDIIETMSLKDGRALNDKLIALARGEVQPDRSSSPELIDNIDVHVELCMMFEKVCASAIRIWPPQPCFDFMNAQTDPRRLTKMNLEQYLEYRLGDVGKDALICFTQGVHLTEDKWALVDPVDKDSAQHISVINAIWSYDKEFKATGLNQEGSTMLNAVDILADEASMPIESAKRVLYQLCREWEIVHETLISEILSKHDSPRLRAYFKETEYQMSGNEIWSRLTLRYSQIH
ncbi:Aristolochene synthase in complex with 12,13 Difluorofarnesyl diphosphate [Xylaria sp. FL1042]|nr:Aristolochene synthase in complex with 12,13 Difluorofarnesyl diphosphate [Xylaria sp. FL1042]